MYAIVRTGGKQYEVAEGDSLAVERLEGKPGSKLMLSDVLFVGGDGRPSIGTPLVDGATVTAEVIRQGKAKKVLVFKKKRRKGYDKKRGHRQLYTEIRITKINV